MRKDLLERSLRKSLSTASPVVGRRQSTPPPHAAMAAAPTEVVVAALSPSQAAAADNSDRKPLRSILHNTVIDSDAVIGDTAAHSNSGSCKKMTRYTRVVCDYQLLIWSSTALHLFLCLHYFLSFRVWLVKQVLTTLRESFMINKGWKLQSRLTIIVVC